MNNQQSKDPFIIWAQVLNSIFTPIILPTVGVIFIFRYSNYIIFPNKLKFLYIWIFFTFSLLLPAILITFFRLYQGWSRRQIKERERRTVPYTIAIVCYLFCYYLLCRYAIPFHFKSIIITAIIIMVFCSLFNQKTNISTHCAAMGGITSLTLCHSLKFMTFNPTEALCLLLIVSGIIGSCQIVLHKHTLAQTLIGYGIGIVAAILTIFFI